MSSSQVRSKAFVGFLVLFLLGVSAFAMATKETRQQASLLDAAKEEAATTAATSTTATSTKTKQITATSTKSQKPAAPATGITKEQYTLAVNTLKAENQKKLEDLKVKNQKELEESKLKAQKETEALKAKQTKELEDLAKRQEASMLSQTNREKEMEELKTTQTKELLKQKEETQDTLKKTTEEANKAIASLIKSNEKALATLAEKQENQGKESTNLIKKLTEKISSLPKSISTPSQINKIEDTSKCKTTKKIGLNERSASESGITIECEGDLDDLKEIESSGESIGYTVGGATGCVAGGFVGMKIGAAGGIKAGALFSGAGAIPGGVVGGVAGFLGGCFMGAKTGTVGGSFIGKAITSDAVKSVIRTIKTVPQVIWRLAINLEGKLASLFTNNKVIAKEYDLSKTLIDSEEAQAKENKLEQAETFTEPILIAITPDSGVESYEPTSKVGDEIKNLGQNQLMLVSIGISTDPETINSDFSVFQFENPHDHPIDSSTFGINFKFVGFPGIASSYDPVKQSDYVIEPHTRSRPFVFLEGYFGNENFN